MITKRVYLKLPETTTREGFLHNHWDLRLDTHDCGKECLSETSRPGLISVMRPYDVIDLKKRTGMGGMLFLGLKTGHVCPKDRVLKGRPCVVTG